MMMVAVVVVGMVVVMVVGNEAGAPEMFIVPRLIASYFPWTVTFLCWSRQYNNYALGWFPSLDASGRSPWYVPVTESRIYMLFTVPVNLLRLLC